MAQSSSALRMSQDKNITNLEKGKSISVKSETDKNKNYIISMVGDTIKCTCPYNVHRKFVCKHITDLTGIMGVLKNNNNKNKKKVVEEEESESEESDNYIKDPTYVANKVIRKRRRVENN